MDSILMKTSIGQDQQDLKDYLFEYLSLIFVEN